MTNNNESRVSETKRIQNVNANFAKLSTLLLLTVLLISSVDLDFSPVIFAAGVKVDTKLNG